VAAPRLIVNNLNIGSFTRLQPDEGFDPVDVEFDQPQFGGAPALAEGGVFVADTTRNKAWSVPVWIRTPTIQDPNNANDLVRQVNAQFYAGKGNVDFKPEGASQSTFFDLEAGRLDLQWSAFHHRKGYVKGEVKLWTRPFGHTGTMRSVIPSQMSTAMQGPANYLITGLQGDAPALGNLYVSPSQITGNPGFLMYGMTTLPSFKPFMHPDDLDVGFFLTATKIKTASAIASSYYAFCVNPVASGQVFSAQNIAEFYLRPDMYAGRHRVFAVMSHQFNLPTAGQLQVWLEDRTKYRTEGLLFSASPINERRINAATQIVQLSALGLPALVDLGEITVPSQVPGAAPNPTGIFTLAGRNNFSTLLASPAVGIHGFMLLPLDHCAAVIPTMALSGGPLAVRSWPERDVSAGVGLAPITAETWGPSAMKQTPLMSVFRGDLPKLPEGATQVRLIVWAGGGTPGAFRPPDRMLVQFDVLERFKFMR
jgi:hypothetical protein